MQQENKDEEEELYDANFDCEHEIVYEWSGVKCNKCSGWFCY